MKHLEFYWDVVSPYTYLAVTQLQGIVQRTGARVTWHPFLLGGIHKATGNTSPIYVPSKAMYMERDLARWRDFYGVPMKLPSEQSTFPLNSLLAMRVAIAAESIDATELYARTVFNAYWVQGRDLSNPTELSAVLLEAGLEADAMLAAATTQQIKDALRQNSDRAVLRGAFGAPTFFVGDQMFFGNDRLHFVEAALR